MTNDRLLDTNIIVALNNGDPIILARIVKVNVAIPSIVIGELYYGAYKSNRVNENLARVETLIQKRHIINCDSQTAKIYGRVKNELKTKGRLIPENDLWIGAIALQYNLVLVTRDAHFHEIDTLQTESWSA